MKRMAIMGAALVLGVLLAPVRSAYAWPEPIEAFGSAMQRGDAAAALAAVSDDTVITLPAELLPPDSQLVPAGQRPASSLLTLTGKAQIGAWLDEFIGQDHGRLYIEAPARLHEDTVTANARVVADHLRESFAHWPVGSVDLTIKDNRLTRVALTLPPETLQALRRANPQAYGLPRAPAFRDPNRPRAA